MSDDVGRYIQYMTRSWELGARWLDVVAVSLE